MLRGFKFHIFLLMSTISINVVLCQIELLNHVLNILDESASTYKVSLKIAPHRTHDSKVFVKTGIDLNVSATVYNIPDDIAKDLKYQWSTKNGAILGSAKASSIILKFLEPQDDDYIKVDIYHGNYTSPIIGSKQVNLSAREPVSVVEPTGKFFVEHGELINVKLGFNGSSPFQYCHKFCLDQNFIPCLDFCYPYLETEGHEVNISHYLHYVGNYTLVFDVHNVVSREIKHYRIRINEIVKERSPPFVPIVSSILAVLILLTGVALHLHLRPKTYTETADFDFIRQDQDEDEWEDRPYSLIQRVRYLLFRDHYEESDERRHLFRNEPRESKPVIYS